MINTDNEKEIIPDSMELEVAYWESFKSEWPMQQYMAGTKISHIAWAHNRSTESLKSFFDRKYGKGWAKQGPSKYSRTTSSHNPVPINRIAELLTEGRYVRDIARELGLREHIVHYHIKTKNLREVAANAAHKPAYAAA